MKYLHAVSRLIFFLLVIIYQQIIGSEPARKINDVKIVSAKITDFTIIEILLDGEAGTVKVPDISLTPPLKISTVKVKANTITLTTDVIDLKKSLFLDFRGERVLVRPGDVLNKYISARELGCVWDESNTYFRLFAPRAISAKMVLYESFSDNTGKTFEMNYGDDGVWEAQLPGHYLGKYYCYMIDRTADENEHFDPSKLICDPYSKAVATYNEYQHRGKTLIMDSGKYDWEGDTPLQYLMEDLNIYECHVRDLTADPSSGVSPELAGSYKGLIEKGKTGGIDYIKSLGVNAVEFLPIQEFGNIEYPYGIPLNGIINTWNPYARNHWGYMTSYFFAPDAYYGSGQNLATGGACGIDGRQVNEFKDVVKAFHKEKIAVILDVVFNHISQYDQNCFKQLDKEYYFHLNADGSWCSASGCGNDFKTDRPMSRKFIVDCIKYWMQEYHVDGFRFDLAAMIDWVTIDEIAKEARKINPSVILIAEPWGGGKYDPVGFSQHGWAAWNDQIRNGIKGQSPEYNTSFIFGKYFDFNNLETIKRYITGNLVEDGGLFVEKGHAINYLESHDDHTFGDFVRLGLRDVKPNQIVAGTVNEQKLTEHQMAINKLGALLLFTSQGATMIHEGQEYARSKVIAPTMSPDSSVGMIDHNSYNKDNETNWLNFKHAEMNKELLEYYKGLLLLRNTHMAFRKSDKENILFFSNGNPFAFNYLISGKHAGDAYNFLVLINANPLEKISFNLPSGSWEIVVNSQKAGISPMGGMTAASINVEPISGLVLRKKIE